MNDCAFCGKPIEGGLIRSDGGHFMHGKCFDLGVIITAAKKWYEAEKGIREHHHARADHGGDWVYVPENLATNKQQAEGDLFEAVRKLTEG